MTQNQILHNELDIDDAAAVVLDVKQSGRIGVRFEHFLTHRQDFALEFCRVAPLAEHFLPYSLERISYPRIPRDKTRPGQRLVLPYPCLVTLILIESIEGTDKQSTAAVGTQAQIGFVQQARRSVTGQPGINALAQSCIYLGRIGMRIVIKKNDVQVGCVAQFLSAQLAIAHNRKCGLFPVPPPQSGPCKMQHLIEYQIGKFRQMIAQRFKGQQTLHVPGQQLEHLGMVKMPQHIHLLLRIVAFRLF